MAVTDDSDKTVPLVKSAAVMMFVLVCAHSHVIVVYLSMYRACVYVNKHLCTVNKTQ